MPDLSFSIVSPILLLLAVAISVLKSQWHRLACCIAIIVPTSVHYYFLDDATGWPYYGGAFAASAVSLALLQGIKPNNRHSQIVIHLQIISLCLMFINLAGYVIWYNIWPPQWYNNFVLVLVLMEVLRLFLHTDGDKHDGTDGVYYNWIARHNSSHTSGGG